MARIKLFDIRWTSHTAGPSPVINEFGPNCRVELFFMGCKKAATGNPCLGCFNPGLWQDIGDKSFSPEEMISHLNRSTSLRYLSVLGGEPLDQYEGLLELCKGLKGWHKIVFSHYLKKDIPEELLDHIDILIDGEYRAAERIYDESLRDGFHDAVGSGNQIVWDCHKKIGYAAKDLLGIMIDRNYNLIYNLKEGATKL